MKYTVSRLLRATVKTKTMKKILPRLPALLRRSHRHYSTALYLNPYENHFSYIKDLARYFKSFCSSRCRKNWKKSSRLNRQEKTCDGKVQLTYPGGAYYVPTTVFEQLENEGIIVPEEARYFPYHATFDFECYFDKEKAQELKNTDKLNWQSSHVPLSVKVCSNVSGYQEPKCFVSNGDPNEFITEFIQYLTKISLKSSSLLREQYADVFEALKTVRAPEARDDQLAQIPVGIQEDSQQAESEENENSEEELSDNERNIDLMTSDDEDEEEIEPENEEDRAFLDDETEEQEDISFYRSLNVELDSERRQERRQQRQQASQYEDVLFGQEQTSDNKVLNELEEKLNVYLNELPVLGFNYCKYDLNAVKKFLSPYLIENHPIKFTVKRNNNHMCIKTEYLKLLDISNYVAPGFSYDQFLRAYECEQTKGFFQYEWVDGLDKLNETSLSPHASFYSSLKNTSITAQEYEYYR